MPTNAFGDEIQAGGPSGVNAFGDALQGASPTNPRRAQSIADAAVAGLQNTGLAMAIRGKLPSQQLGEDAPWYSRLAYGAGGLAGDIIPMAAGGFGGAVAGTAVAGPAGTIAGGGAGAFAVPMALREALVEAYTNNHAASWQGVWDITLAALKGGGKGAVIGGATAGAGAVVARGVGAAIAPSIGTSLSVKAGTTAITTAGVGAELATLTSASAAIEGHMPTAQDFMDNAMLLGGFKAAMHVSKGLQNIYAQTGKTPDEVAGDAARNPNILADLKEPVRAYHGTSDDIQAWSVQGNGLATGAAGSKDAIFFTSDPSVANNYAFSFADRPTRDAKREWLAAKETGDPAAIDAAFLNYQKVNAAGMASAYPEGGAVYPVDIRLKNPLVVDFAGKEYFDEGAMTRALAQAKADGHDGVIFKNAKDDPNRLDHRSDIYAVIDPKAIHATWEPAPLPAYYEPLALHERIKAAIDADPRPEALRSAMQDRDAPPKLGTPGEHDPVKYEYITDSDTLKGVLPQLEALYKREIDAQTRGVVPDKEVAAKGLRMAVRGDVAEHIIGTAESPEAIRARGHLLTGFSNRAFNLLRTLNETPAEEQTPVQKLEVLQSIEQLSLAVADFRGARAEAGRALRVFRAMKADADTTQADILVKLYEQKGSLSEVARMVAEFKDPTQMQHFAEGYAKATTFEKVYEAWASALVSGPQTSIANVLGNIGKWAVDVVEKPVSATLFGIDRAVKNDPISWAQWRARAFSPWIGLAYGAKDAATVVAAAARTLSEQGAVEGTKSLAKAASNRLDQTDSGKAELRRPAIEGTLGTIVRLPFTALQVQDLMFRTVGERAQAHVLAVDRATKENFNPATQEGKERIALYMDNPEYGLDAAAAKEARLSIEQAGSEAVFSQKLGRRMQFLQLSMEGSPAKLVVPFFRTPVNLLSWAVQHTPGGNFLSARWLEDFGAGGERRANAVARVTIGVGLTTMAYSLAESGLLTGGGLFDKEEKGTKTAAGWQPYSVKVGDTYYSYQRMEPVAKVLGIAADLIELQKNLKDDEDKAKVAMMLVAMFGNATVSTTYLSGLSGAINATTDPQRYAGQFLEQYATSLVPKVVGQSAQMMDPNKRQVDSVMDAIQSQIPFFREKLLPARDVWGEPKRNDKWFDFMPVATSKESHDLVKTEAMRLQLAVQDAPKFLFEKGPLKPEDKRFQLEPEQRDIVRAVSGQKSMEILSPIVNSEDWKSIPDFAKVAIYKKVIEQSRTVGKLSAVPADAKERDELRSKIIEEVLKQVDEAQQRTLK